MGIREINFRYILNNLGLVWLMEALFMILAIMVSIIYHGRDLSAFIYSLFIIAFLGLVGYTLTLKNLKKELTIRDSFLLVSISWISLCVLGSLPYIFSHCFPSTVDAVFESVSGFTTTGSSILTDIEVLPKGILFWRSETHWIGGMGIILLVLAILPGLKFGGSQLFYAESSGLEEERIRPRIIDVAKRLWGIYIMLTLLEIVFLCLGGMSFYDSVCHAFGTIATGGFSTHNQSIGAYSPYIQYVIMFFMFLSGINFTIHYFSLKGRFKSVIRNEELRAYVSFIIVAGLIISAILIFSKHLPLWVAIRHAFFQVVSIITATGFATTDYLSWPNQAWIILFFLMFIGACAGSTGGGIKVLRHVILIKKISNGINRLIHPNAVLPVRYNRNPLAPELVNSILGFIAIYISIFMLGTFVMSAIGMDLRTAMGSVITTMGGIGPGIGKVGPAANFYFIPALGKLFLSFLMILGRLEVYSLLVIFTPAFWRL